MCTALYLVLNIVSAHKAGEEGFLSGLVWVFLRETAHSLSLGHGRHDSS
jgi:hypothetical protein